MTIDVSRGGKSHMTSRPGAASMVTSGNGPRTARPTGSTTPYAMRSVPPMVSAGSWTHDPSRVPTPQAKTRGDMTRAGRSTAASPLTVAGTRIVKQLPEQAGGRVGEGGGAASEYS